LSIFPNTGTEDEADVSYRLKAVDAVDPEYFELVFDEADMAAEFVELLNSVLPLDNAETKAHCKRQRVSFKP
jgi:hypothetical protein